MVCKVGRCIVHTIMASTSVPAPSEAAEDVFGGEESRGKADGSVASGDGKRKRRARRRKRKGKWERVGTDVISAQGEVPAVSTSQAETKPVRRGSASNAGETPRGIDAIGTLSRLLQQRRSLPELEARNIIQGEPRVCLFGSSQVAGPRVFARFTAHSLKQQMRVASTHLGRKLRSRPGMRGLMKKGFLKEDPTNPTGIRRARAAVLQHHGKDTLHRRLRNRRSRHQLVELGIVKPLDTSPASSELSSAAISRSSSPRAFAQAQLDQALRARPPVSELLQAGLLHADTVLWSPLETEWQAPANVALPPPAARNCHSLSEVNGQVLLVAGYAAPECSCMPYLLDVDNATWSTSIPMAPPKLPSHDITPPALRARHASDALDEGFKGARRWWSAPSNFDRCGSAAAGKRVGNLAEWPTVLPAPRYAHSCISCCGLLLVCGGYGDRRWLNDVWLYDPANSCWCPGNVWSAVLGVLEDHDRASGRVGGGSAGVSDIPPAQVGPWRDVQVSTELPAPRAAHSMVALPVRAWSEALAAASGDCADGAGAVQGGREELCGVLFGGNDGAGLFNDVWLLREVPQVKELAAASMSMHTPLAWSKPVVVGGAPAPRAGHSAVLHGSTMVVFGGSRGFGTPAFNDLHMLDVGNIQPWAEGDEGGAECMVFWYTPTVSGKAPSARAGHAACVVGHNMLVIGGSDARRSYNDLYVFDCTAHAWSRPAVSGPRPCPRAGHAVTAVGDTVVLFGGADGEGNLLGDAHIMETDFLLRTLPMEGPLPSSVRSAGGGGSSTAASSRGRSGSATTVRSSHQATPAAVPASTGPGIGEQSEPLDAARPDDRPSAKAALQAFAERWDAKWGALQSRVAALREEQAEELRALMKALGE